MSSSKLENEWASSYLSGGNMAYVDGLYEDYLNDPASVSDEWRQTFDALPRVDGQLSDISHRDIREHFLQNADRRPAQLATGDDKQAKVTNLINAYRAYGHLAAKLDPLDMIQRPVVPNLTLAYHQLTDADLNHVFFAGATFPEPNMTLADIYQTLKDTYSRSIGIEYKHIANPQETLSLQQK